MSFNEVLRQIDDINKSKKERITTFIIALVFTLLIVSAPVLILINLGIYKNYLKLIVFISSLLLIFAFYLVQYFYYKGISEGKIKGIWIVCLHDTLFPSIIIMLLILILFRLGVV